MNRYLQIMKPGEILNTLIEDAYLTSYNEKIVRDKLEFCCNCNISLEDGTAETLTEILESLEDLKTNLDDKAAYRANKPVRKFIERLIKRVKK